MRRCSAAPNSARRRSLCSNRRRSRTRNTRRLLGEYGRALADNGRLQQALEVLSRAHTPDLPDWRILNAQGAIHDQLGNYKEARRYYQTALKIVPDEPSVLSNQGISYILSKDLTQAETILAPRGR